MNIQISMSVNNVSGHNFIRPLSFDPSVESATLVQEILRSAAFRRLDSIRFLGGIDYAWIKSPNGAANNVRYTRGQHSLGVAKLALRYIEHVGIEDRAARNLFVAALLHDIGHAPLSHSLEPVFESEFGLTHHGATEQIIRGDVALGRDLHKVLIEQKIDIDEVIELISGRDKRFNGFFAGPINFDTIEGISRSRTYSYTSASLAQPDMIIDAAISRTSQRDREIVDEFWKRKNETYRYIINSRTGILADYVCQMFMRQNIAKFTSDDYFITEEAAFKKLPGLQSLLTGRDFELEVWNALKETISYTARIFYIDNTSDFFTGQDSSRYRQFKERRQLEALRRSSERIETTKDLFDDHPVRES